MSNLQCCARQCAPLSLRNTAPRFLDQPSAAAYLGISGRAFEYRWRVDAMPGPTRIGRRLLWDRRVLDQWADRVSGLGPKANDFGD